MKLKNPFLIVLVGPTLSGKSTWIKTNYPNINVISRDEIVMEVANTNDYNKAFSQVDHKEVDKILLHRFQQASQLKVSTIVDMTNMTKKRRVKTLSYFTKDFQKIAVIFPILSNEEYQIRNDKRNKEENKWIPPSVIQSMIDSFEVPEIDEGFSEIIHIDF